MATLTVAVDGSPQAGNVLLWTRRVAAATGAKVVQVPVDPSDKPGPVLLDAADREGADLVVVAGGSPHGRPNTDAEGPATDAEGIADYVAHHSRRPYAVVPAAASGELPRCLAIGCGRITRRRTGQPALGAPPLPPRSGHRRGSRSMC